MLLEKNAFDSIAFFSQCTPDKCFIYCLLLSHGKCFVTIKKFGIDFLTYLDIGESRVVPAT